MPEPRPETAVERFTRFVIRWRWAIIAMTVIAALPMISGARFLTFNTSYRAFFSKQNPQLESFEALQNIYTKNDNILFVLEPADDNAFTASTLSAVEELTAEAWKIPFAIRVDAVTNFQHTRATEDDLIVEDLVENAAEMSPSDIASRKAIAINDPLLRNRLVPPAANVTGVNVTLQLPGDDITEVPRAVAAARDLASRIESNHPGIKTYLTGMVMMNNSFSEAGQNDLMVLIPLVYMGMLVVMVLMLRSFAGTLATLAIIAFSSMTAMGLAGWAGVKLTPPTVQAPTMIMTLAVADSIHILVTMLRGMRRGAAKIDAIVESMRVNMQPVFLTSLTTAIGFLSMNFSDAPPFRDLGNITAVGVMIAFVLSVTFLPALISVLPFRVKLREEKHVPGIDRFADFVVRRKRPLLWSSAAVVLLFALLIPKNELNDQFVTYFDERVQFRTDTDFVMDNLSGMYQVEHSLGAGESGGISNPEYLATLEQFASWYESQPGVVHVNSFSEIMRRLNKNLHGDDPSYYRVPETRELAAQYLLLYEMSLPYGLDLNNQINVDKSATRFTVTLENLRTNEIRALANRGEQWLRDHAPASMFSQGSGPSVMFSYIAARNIRSMLLGTGLAILLIAACLVIALRSVKFGLLSLVPNVIPAVLAFGTWGVVVGEIGLALSVVSAMTLGIVVDDSVHFISKYLRARREKKLDSEGAVRYAFSSVGLALVVTSAILVAGFLVMSFSSFKLNAGMGQLTAITIAWALIADFILLPPVLMLWADRTRDSEATQEVYPNEIAPSHVA